MVVFVPGSSCADSSQTVLQNQIANHAGVFEQNRFPSRLSKGAPVTEQLPPERVDLAVRLPARGLLARPIEQTK
jgi:hypothetical protein